MRNFWCSLQKLESISPPLSPSVDSEVEAVLLPAFQLPAAGSSSDTLSHNQLFSLAYQDSWFHICTRWSGLIFLQPETWFDISQTLMELEHEKESFRILGIGFGLFLIILVSSSLSVQYHGSSSSSSTPFQHGCQQSRPAPGVGCCAVSSPSCVAACPGTKVFTLHLHQSFIINNIAYPQLSSSWSCLPGHRHPCCDS